VFKLSLRKPDGRQLILYSRRPISAGLPTSDTTAAAIAPETHLRWHPLRGEWVAYAEHRQHRTFLPGSDFNPLAPTTDPIRPTELPAGDYDVAVFDNLFPTLTPTAGNMPADAIVETRAAKGACEVVVYTQDADTTLGALPLSHIELLLFVWGDRYRELGAKPDVEYVMPFENRGVEVGVTVHHPHGQIFAYPFVPPVPARELDEQLKFLDARGRGLLEAHVQAEMADGRRMLYASEQVAAFVPACARYPYEVWIVPTRPAPSLAALRQEERQELARALKTVLLKYDGLWSRPFPYVMVMHSAPTDGGEHPEAHFHVEFYPPLRMRDRLKYVAGGELGAGMFTADTLPEEKAAELRAVQVALE